MRPQFTKNLSRSPVSFLFVCAALTGSVSASETSRDSAALSRSGLPSSSSLADRPNWMERVMALMENLYLLLGGDPATLDRSGTADARILNLTDYFNETGIPSGLSTAQRELLIEDIHDLYALTFLSIEGISAHANLELRKSLENLWVSLGLDLEDLAS